jgi:hypothetical protein
LQVKIYGDKSGSEYKTQEVKLSANSATTTVDFDASKLGTNVYRITLQTMVGAQEARVRSAKLIKADGSEVDGSITVAWGCEVKSEAVPSGIRSVETVRTDGAIYDLQGRRIQQTPQRGLYIQNGKKYMVK